jgi:glycerophosphoryl diester phosphodiesterase
MGSPAKPRCPGVQQRLPSLLEVPIMFAHRGARAHAPENTIEAFSLALKLGATGLESDVWMTRDGVATPIGAVQSHDLPEHIPALHQLFDVCGTSYHLSLDLKDDESGAAVVELVAALAPDMLERLWLCHPVLDVLTDLRPLHDRVKLVDSTRLARIQEGPERRAARLAEVGIDGINMRNKDWNGGLVALFHRFDRATFAWDLQFEHDLGVAYRMGIDAVYSDHVDRMVEVFRREIGSPSV